MNIKGLVFDLDGVIAVTDKFHFQAWKNQVKSLGINYTEEVNNGLKGLPRVKTLEAIIKTYNVKNISNEEIAKISKQKNNEYLEILEKCLSKKHILPTIEDFLKQAKAKGLKLAIASTSRNAPWILKKINLDSYFSYIVDPTQVENGKPAPDIFLKACEGINLKPSEVIGFEDALPGLRGLIDAKIKSVGITWGDTNLKWQEANLVLSSTKELDLEEIMQL